MGQKVLLLNSRLKFMSGKLRSRWDGPFVITKIFPFGAVELCDPLTGQIFKVNGHRLKQFHEGSQQPPEGTKILLIDATYPP